MRIGNLGIGVIGVGAFAATLLAFHFAATPDAPLPGPERPAQARETVSRLDDPTAARIQALTEAQHELREAVQRLERRLATAIGDELDADEHTAAADITDVRVLRQRTRQLLT